MSGFPILQSTPGPFPGERPAAAAGQPERADAHLRSTTAVNGYHLRVGDTTLGHVCDFLMDDQSWVIPELVIKIGHRFSGKEVRIPASQVDRISYDESTVFVKMTIQAVDQSPAYHLVPEGAAR